MSCDHFRIWKTARCRASDAYRSPTELLQIACRQVFQDVENRGIVRGPRWPEGDALAFGTQISRGPEPSGTHDVYHSTGPLLSQNLPFPLPASGLPHDCSPACAAGIGPGRLLLERLLRRLVGPVELGRAPCRLPAPMPSLPTAAQRPSVRWGQSATALRLAAAPEAGQSK